jgi:hypothetical protein
VAVRILALAFVIAQEMSCGECVFNCYFEHLPSRRALDWAGDLRAILYFSASAGVSGIRRQKRDPQRGRAGLMRPAHPET